MKIIKNCMFDFIGDNKETKKLSFAFELKGYKYNDKYLYCESTTYFGNTYRLDRLSGDIAFCNRSNNMCTKKYSIEYCEKNNLFEYSFTINPDSLKIDNDFIREHTK